MAREQYMWCVVKRAAVKEAPDVGSNTAFYLPFGKAVFIFKKIKNGMIRILVNVEDKNGGKGIEKTGWISPAALTRYKVVDYARLKYINKTGKIIPTTLRYNGKVAGKIMPGEHVTMIAKVGKLCLTSRGWTKFEWLTKEHYISDQEALETLCYGILARAVQDYRICVKRLQAHRYKDDHKYRELLAELRNISAWFQSDEYKLMFDAVPGAERLKRLNESLGVDEAWLDEMFRDRMSRPRIRTKEMMERRSCWKTHATRSGSTKMSKRTASGVGSKSSGNV